MYWMIYWHILAIIPLLNYILTYFKIFFTDISCNMALLIIRSVQLLSSLDLKWHYATILPVYASKSFWWYTDLEYGECHLCHCHSTPGAPGIAHVTLGRPKVFNLSCLGLASKSIHLTAKSCQSLSISRHISLGILQPWKPNSASL